MDYHQDPLTWNEDETVEQEKLLKVKSTQEYQLESFMWVMGDPRGRSFVQRLMVEMAGLYRPSFQAAGAPDLTAFREGERNVALRLLGEIKTHCPELLLQMTKEQQEHDATIASIKQRPRN